MHGWTSTKEPVIVSVPDTGGRYYLLPMLDMWTDVFASPGWRTTGTQAQLFLVAPTGWRPDLRDRFIEEFRLPRDTQRIDAPTPHVWIIGRTKTDGPPDYAAVNKIQAGLKVTPLSEWGRSPRPVEVKTDPTIDMKTPPKVQVDSMRADKYFAYAAELLKVNPPHFTDEPIIATDEEDRHRARQGLRHGQSRASGEEGVGECSGSRPAAHEVEGPIARQGRKRLVDEHRHHGRVRELLS